VLEPQLNRSASSFKKSDILLMKKCKRTDNNATIVDASMLSGSKVTNDQTI
jgi:hypothetical protein